MRSGRRLGAGSRTLRGLVLPLVRVAGAIGVPTGAVRVLSGDRLIASGELVDGRVRMAVDAVLICNQKVLRSTWLDLSECRAPTSCVW